MSLQDGSMLSVPVATSYVMFSGPSGAGKTTVIKRLLEKNGEKYKKIVSHTTRLPRDGEKDKVHYHFVDRTRMEHLIGSEQMLQVVEFDGHKYGILKKSVFDDGNTGKVCIFDVLAKSALELKNIIGGPSVLIFIKPPTIEVLNERRRARGDMVNMEGRTILAEEELEYASLFDHVIVNDDLDRAFGEIQEIVTAELRKISGGNMA